VAWDRPFLQAPPLPSGFPGFESGLEASAIAVGALAQHVAGTAHPFGLSLGSGHHRPLNQTHGPASSSGVCIVPDGNQISASARCPPRGPVAVEACWGRRRVLGRQG